jgi:hypothetical protein
VRAADTELGSMSHLAGADERTSGATEAVCP